MEKLATENLFLLEFLVDDVQMSGKCDCDTPPGELCVSFQFLDNDPLDVCEQDFTPNRQYGKDKESNIRSGKSCLFSLTPKQVQESTQIFDLTVTVFKKMQPGWLPDKICIGSALISIANLFVELIQSVEESSESTPAAKTLKDTFDLADSTGSNSGKISIYIRMSCFGKLIVTQFQMNLNDKSVLFKDKGGQSLYRYKKARKSGETKIEDVPRGHHEGGLGPSGDPNAYGVDMGGQYGQYPQSQGNWNAQCPMNPCFPQQSQGAMMGGGFDQSQMGMGGGMMFNPAVGQGAGGMPCSECNMMPLSSFGPPGPSYNEFGAGGQMQQHQMMGQPSCLPPDGGLTPCIECGTMLQPQFAPEGDQPPPDPPGNYQEIGATMGGNSLTIRVHKDKGKIEQVDGSEGGGSSCCCAIGQVGTKKPKASPQGGGGGAQQPQCFDVRPGLQQGEKNLPFSFKMSGQGAPTNNNVTINPPVSTKPDGSKYTEISDPNKEVFVLRIGKKNEGAQKKANLELELCTPRGPDIKPIPKKETRDSQYDPGDCKGGDGKKGKKGKGKKGGKKGKKGKK